MIPLSGARADHGEIPANQEDWRRSLWQGGFSGTAAAGCSKACVLLFFHFSQNNSFFFLLNLSDACGCSFTGVQDQDHAVTALGESHRLPLSTMRHLQQQCQPECHRVAGLCVCLFCACRSRALLLFFEREDNKQQTVKTHLAQYGQLSGFTAYVHH